MGFASMFENVREKGGFASIVYECSNDATQKKQTNSLPLPTANLPEMTVPAAFSKKARSFFQEYGVPSYLVDRYVRWLYQVSTGRKSVDQAFEEFAREAIPLLTQYLLEKDGVTVAFVKRLMR